MSKNLEVLKADVKKLMLKDWTETEVTKLDEFMEDVIIATMLVNKLPIHIVVGQSEQLPQKSENCVSISPEPCKYKGVCKICS